MHHSLVARTLSARSFALVEPLETRTLMSLSMTSDGFIDVAPSDDSRVLYVSSSSGDDSNDGRSPSDALRTIKKAKSKMRDGMPDQMLLRRGDYFDESFGHWTMSGRSSDEPMLLGAYGEGERPLLNTNIYQGFATYGGDPVNNIFIDGIHFNADGYDGKNGGYQTAGIQLLREGSGYVFQDLEINGYKDNIVIQGDGDGVDSVILRRSIITDAYARMGVGNGHSQGLYVAGTSSHVMIEQNVFDHNGWKEGVSEPTMFNHNIYVNTGATSVAVRNNLIANASLNGVLMRSGGSIVDNLFVRNPVAAIVNNTSSTITGNVVLQGTDLPTQSLSVGFNIESVPSATVSNNLIANDIGTGRYGAAAISVNPGANDVNVDNNTVYNWRNGIVNSGEKGISITNNTLQSSNLDFALSQQATVYSKHKYYYSGNMYSSKRGYPFKLNAYNKTFKQYEKAIRETDGSWDAVDYVDPTRTLGDYNATLGGRGSVEAFLAAARTLSRTNWNVALTADAAAAYIREGFNMQTEVQTVKLKLSPKASFLTTIAPAEDPDVLVSSVTTVAPKETKKPKKKEQPQDSQEALPETATSKPAEQTKQQDDAEKDDSNDILETQQSLLARIIGLLR
jgi:hypothetical protein